MNSLRRSYALYPSAMLDGTEAAARRNLGNQAEDLRLAEVLHWPRCTANRKIQCFLPKNQVFVTEPG